MRGDLGVIAAQTAGARAQQLAAGLEAVQDRLSRAAEAAGRSRAELTLVAVSKTWPASDVALLRQLGVTDFGENRLQEAVTKAAAVAADEPAGSAPVRWHVVGRLQRNKARSAGRLATAVHSLDRSDLIAPIARGAADADRVVDVFVQVSLDGDAARGGVADDGELLRLGKAVADAPWLRLAGVMAVAPVGLAARDAFARLRSSAERLRAEHPQAVSISAGMSGDLEDAIAEGATHLRIGSALFGVRA